MLCCQSLLTTGMITQRQYEKQDYERRKTMANIAITILTVLMMVCAGVKVM